MYLKCEKNYSIMYFYAFCHYLFFCVTLLSRKFCYFCHSSFLHHYFRNAINVSRLRCVTEFKVFVLFHLIAFFNVHVKILNEKFFLS